eukprot:COSAG05_NODE_1_length_66591_cov_307.301581_49_plen_34_part_00
MYDGISYLYRVMGPRIDVDVFICSASQSSSIDT